MLRADNGATALQLLEQEDEIAVIISDQRMPQMSGTEFLSLTASRYPDTIRIILTGYTDVEDLVDAINAGKVFKYVTKPWNPDELKSVVQQAVDTHNVLRARTRELQRALRQESLLNAVTHQIRSASGYRAILQTIVEAAGQMFEVDCAIIRSWNNSCPIAYPAASQLQEDFIYVRSELQSGLQSEPAFTGDWLAHTLWHVNDVERIDDAQQNCRVLEDATGLRQQAYAIAQIASSLLVPLTYQQNQMAVLALHYRHQPHEWQDDEVNLICMVADQAALALAQAQAYEQVQALATRAALVNKITATIRSSLEPQAIFAAITQELGQALRADGCALSLWTEDDAYVQCVGLYDASAGVTIDLGSEAAMPFQSSFQLGFSSSLLQSSVPLSNLSQSNLSQSNLPLSDLPQSQVPIAENPVLQKLLTTQGPVVIDDLSQQPQMHIIDLPLRSPARSLLVVPLLHDGKIIGSISLRQVNQPRFWETVEVELAQTVAAQAAIAVQQARLYQTTRQQAEQLLQLDRQKTEFFQNVSHEFRTPLTLTIGPLESAVENGEGLPYDQAVIALRNSRRLLRLVNQLLDLQRLDAGRMQPRFRPTNLLEFVAQVVESFRPYCDKKQITLRTELQPCPPLFLDLERFDKVLYNLLSNAIKFTPAGGTIEVSLSAAEECAIRVRDTGIGIQSDQIPELFERFRQADGSTSRRHEGSGLGLALVKELVELHSGRVTVESVYGEGTVFTVWLKPGTEHLAAAQIDLVPAELEPIRAPVELADIETELVEQETLPSAIEFVSGHPLILPESMLFERSAREVAQEKTARILVVEDNADMRSYISGILKQKGYAIDTARHGGEGLQKAKALLPDLIVTDLMMPLVSGTEMIHQIRQDSQLKGTPIVLLTAKADEDTRIAGTEQGADAFLAKPFNRRELLAEVRNLLALKENERKVAELNAYLTESVLRRFLPPPLVEKAARGELALDLRPEPRMITVLFSDIIGFAQLSNNLRSRRIAELLNEYLTEMTEAIFANGGTVDKFMGDAILAIFGAPEEISPNEQVKRAIAAARQMYRTLGKLNERWQAQGISQVQFRCGIHQGTAVVGMFGGTERADYTAIGPSVNIAARIQEAADPDSILVSAAVADYLELEEDAITKFSPLQLKGIDETVLTFSIHPDLDAKK